MEGTAQQRHCAHCNKNVYNFAAMTSREVEHLLANNEGRLCARITRRGDDSVLKLDGASRPGVAAGLVLAASLAMGNGAGAQSAPVAPNSAKAHLRGTVLRPDGLTPWAEALVVVQDGQNTISTVKTDGNGAFEIIVDPGTYDVAILGNVLVKTRITNAVLHAGDQSLQPIRLVFRESGVQEYVTMGELVSTFHYPISFLFRHPVQYLKHLPHNF